MLWTTIDKDGTLTVQTNEPLEAYALEQWEKQHKRGKASLKIDTSATWTLEDFANAIGKDLIAFNKWRSERKHQVVSVTTEIAAALDGLKRTEAASATNMDQKIAEPLNPEGIK